MSTARNAVVTFISVVAVLLAVQFAFEQTVTIRSVLVAAGVGLLSVGVGPLWESWRHSRR
ncbi:hypothetical protein ABZX99_04945 [Streptomyces antibioticus]|uniref:hypothetical protein n=1 Tax=Streptomyces TaxID=1883 RepID=UPI001587298F|nr:hypothetical protein [Streptomyces sp. CAI-85]MBO7936366.1 hypothetical protein [Streptomyces sp. S9]NUV60768.1 hypothetical protein [Streptomyces sp. CAI-85]